MSRYRDIAVSRSCLFTRLSVCPPAHVREVAQRRFWSVRLFSSRHRRRSIADLSAWKNRRRNSASSYEFTAGSGISSRVLAGIQFDREAARFLIASNRKTRRYSRDEIIPKLVNFLFLVARYREMWERYGPFELRDSLSMLR